MRRRKVVVAQSSRTRTRRSLASFAFGAFAGVAALAASACGAATGSGDAIVVAPTMTSTPIAPEITNAPAPIAGSEARAPQKHDVAGTWREDFEGRTGCSDTIAVSYVGSELHLDSANCDDGAAYEIDDVTYDGNELRFKLKVGASGWTLRYRLTYSSDDTFEGEAEAPGGEPHTIRWQRAKRP